MMLAVTLLSLAGIEFQRTVLKMPEWASGSLTFTGPEVLCLAKDEYGSDDCILPWGQFVDIDYDIKLTNVIPFFGTFYSEVLIDGMRPWTLVPRCDACGENCTLEIPGWEGGWEPYPPFFPGECPLRERHLQGVWRLRVPAAPIGLEYTTYSGKMIVENFLHQIVAEMDFTFRVARWEPKDMNRTKKVVYSQKRTTTITHFPLAPNNTKN